MLFDPALLLCSLFFFRSLAAALPRSSRAAPQLFPSDEAIPRPLDFPFDSEFTDWVRPNPLLKYEFICVLALHDFSEVRYEGRSV